MDSDAKGSAPRVLRTAKWGLSPSWAKDAKIGSRLINARSETVTEKPSFRAAASARRRCLVPAYRLLRMGEGQGPQGVPVPLQRLSWRSPQRAGPERRVGAHSVSTTVSSVSIPKSARGTPFLTVEVNKQRIRSPTASG
jgi:hypothetical protein